MKSISGSEAFIAYDLQFTDSLQTAQKLDPLQLRHDGSINAFQARSGTAPVENAQEATERLLDWQTNRLGSAETAETRAVLRDYDKVIGAFVARQVPFVESVPKSAQAIENFRQAGILNPRANFYDYSFANTLDLEATYTSDEREVKLLGIFNATTKAAHLALHAVLKGREALLTNDTGAVNHIEEAHEHIQDIRRPMASVYRDVGPSFVANEVTRYLGGMRYKDEYYEGPNPSGSAFMALDRFVYGSLDLLVANNAMLAAQVEFRKKNLPAHLQQLISTADEQHDSKGLVELAKEHEPSLALAASAVATSLRKFKVMHKSYADKGLSAKKGAITNDNPDLLSDSIQFARSKET